MGQKCKPNYKNLNTIQSYSEQKYATVQWCDQNCENDEWLRQQVENLKYLSSPAVRYKFNIGETVDGANSWGYSIMSNDKVGFSLKRSDTITIDYSNFNDWIDWSKSSIVQDNYTDIDEETGKEIPKTRIILPNGIENGTIAPNYARFGTAVMYNDYNAAWYVGFDKTKNFYLHPDWIKNWKHKDIPAIARAQTFKVPKGKGGKLESVDLQLEYNGSPSTTSNPLYVQIWTTKKQSVVHSTWNNKKYCLEYTYVTAPANTPYQRYRKIITKVKDKKGNIVYTDKKKKKPKYNIRYKADKNGKYIRKRDRVAVPDYKSSGVRFPLAQAVYNPQSSTKGGFQTITFTNPPTLRAEQSYAIVLLSPHNNWSNCPRWGGWTRNCKRDKAYVDGDAFYSPNNGRTWKRYGKFGMKEENIKEFRQGRTIPQDYRFQCNIRTNEDTIYEEGVHELRLKPIFNNPIKKVILSPDSVGTEDSVQDEIQLVYQLSVDGRTWTNFPDNFTLYLEKPSKVIFIRALLSRTEGSNYQSKTPYIESITVNLETELPKEMHVRTKPYTPPLGHILGASVWGRIFAPYVTNPTVDCKVDVIDEKEREESFDIVELDLLDEKLEELELDTEWMKTHATLKQKCEYLSEHPELLDEYKYNSLYIKPYEVDNLMYNLSFAPSEDKLVVSPSDTVEATDDETGQTIINNIFPDELGGISIVDDVVYPIISCELEPEDGTGHGSADAYGEWYDYEFDYTNNKLIFHRDVLEDMVCGNLVVKYNGVFVKDLTNDEIGVHYDSDTGLRSDGLILDYFKERFVITDENIETRRVKLKVPPTDPIKQVYLYKYDADEGDEPLELIEDSDFTLDIYSNELVFETNNTNGVSTILSLGDTLQVVYTPSLNTDSISIAYNATRTNSDMQCYLNNYYIEYRV